MADTATAPATDSGSKRVEKPDDAKYKADLEAAEKTHKKNKDEFVGCPRKHSMRLLTLFRMPFVKSSTKPDLAKVALATIDGLSLSKSRRRSALSRANTNLVVRPSRTSSMPTIVRSSP